MKKVLVEPIETTTPSQCKSEYIYAYINKIGNICLLKGTKETGYGFTYIHVDSGKGFTTKDIDVAVRSAVIDGHDVIEFETQLEFVEWLKKNINKLRIK